MPGKKKRTKGLNKAGFLVTGILALTCVGAVARYITVAHADHVPAAEHREDPGSEPLTHRSPQIEVSPHASNRPIAGDSTKIYSPVWDKDTLRFTSKQVSLPDNEDPKVFAVNQYLQNTKIADAGAKLLDVQVHDGTADLHFNGVMGAHSVGSEDEQMLLDGIRITMGQFPEIDKVRFFANGKPIETFGNVDLTEAQPVIRHASDASTHAERSGP